MESRSMRIGCDRFTKPRRLESKSKARPSKASACPRPIGSNAYPSARRSADIPRDARPSESDREVVGLGLEPAHRTIPPIFRQVTNDTAFGMFRSRGFRLSLIHISEPT